MTPPARSPQAGELWLYGLPFVAAVDLGLMVLAGTGIELLRPRHLLLPAVVSIVIVGLALVVGRLLARSAPQVAFISVLFVLAFGTLGDTCEGIEAALALEPIRRESLVALLYILAVAGPTLAARQRTRPLLEWCRIMGLTLAFVCVVTSVRIVWQLVPDPPPRVDSGIRSERPQSTRPPDIYLLVMDKYTGTKPLARHYGLDVAPFQDWLRTRGFLVPEDQRANYVQTFLTLASMLNLRYLDDYPARFGADARSRLVAGPEIENNRLAAFLKERGYRFVFLPTSFDVTRRNRYADLQLPDPRDVRADFTVAWYRSTAIPVLHRLACNVLGCDATPWPYVSESADVMDAKFDLLARLVKTNQPTFVLAHLLLPHEPYLYQADCSRRRPYWPATDTGVAAGAIRAAYAAQVECTNRKLRGLIEVIQGEAPSPPVILVQGDHGHGRMGHPVFPLSHWLPDELVEERLSSFAAYSLPGLPPDSIYSGISPVNVMRLVLRWYFGAELPPLDDASYWSSTNRPYSFTRVH